MFAFVLSRILQAIPVLLVVGARSPSRCSPMSAIRCPIMLGQDHTEAQRLALVHQLGLDQPFFVQYAQLLWAALHGDFGISYRLAQPVSELIAERLPATLELALTASMLAIAIGVPMGVYTGIHRNSLAVAAVHGGEPDRRVAADLPDRHSADPDLLRAARLAAELRPRRRGAFRPWWTTGFLTLSGLKALILPAVTLGLFQMTLIMRLVRAEMLEVLRTDYIRFARARGLSDRAINFGHALKNTLVPVITIIGLQFGGLVAFSLVTETVFQWPGMGLLLVQSVAVADIPVMSAYLLLIALCSSRSTWSSICCTTPSIRACACAAWLQRDGPQSDGPPRNERRRALLRQRFRLQLPPLAGGGDLGAGAAGLRAGRGARAVAGAARPDRPRQPHPAGQFQAAGLSCPTASSANPLGTDDQGRDVLSGIMYGMRISLLVGVLAVAFAIVSASPSG